MLGRVDGEGIVEVVRAGSGPNLAVPRREKHSALANCGATSGLFG